MGAIAAGAGFAKPRYLRPGADARFAQHDKPRRFWVQEGHSDQAGTLKMTNIESCSR